MATVNLGRIKPVFRGAYNNSTAYVVDDIVTSGNETFICISASTGNATSNGTFWTKLAAKGADGTDVGTTLTTQGDILYRDGSGLQRLAAGTSGQALLTQGSGANPIWGSAGGIKQVVTNEVNTTFTQSSPVNETLYFPSSSKLSAQITPSSTSSKILVQYVTSIRMDSSSGDMGMGTVVKESISGGSTTNIHPGGSQVKPYSSGFYYASTVASDARLRVNEIVLRSPSTTSQITYEVGISGYNLNSMRMNDDTTFGRIILMEVTV
jgi:hypothetical protein